MSSHVFIHSNLSFQNAPLRVTCGRPRSQFGTQCRQASQLQRSPISAAGARQVVSCTTPHGESSERVLLPSTVVYRYSVRVSVHLRVASVRDNSE